MAESRSLPRDSPFAVVDARSYEWMPYIDIDHVPGPRGHALTS